MPAFSGLFDNEPDINGDGASGYAHLVGRLTHVRNLPSGGRRIAKILRTNGARSIREALDTLLGAASGTAAATYVRVQGRPGLTNNLGGVVPTETRTAINESVDSTDTALLKSEIINQTFKPSSYPTDASGNGGGGKSGF